jgi:hypothetical protein
MTVPDDSTPPPRSCRQIDVDQDGVEFVACDESKYKSLNVHRSRSGTRHNKSIWNGDLSRGDECHAFCEAHLQKWHDGEGDCWSVAKDEGGIPFGTRDERLAFFWAPQNDPDPWHGFPVSRKGELPFSKSPPDWLVEQWRASERITFTRYVQLLKGRW